MWKPHHDWRSHEWWGYRDIPLIGSSKRNTMTTGGVPLRGTWSIAEPETPPFAASLAHGEVFTLVIAFGDCGQTGHRAFAALHPCLNPVAPDGANFLGGRAVVTGAGAPAYELSPLTGLISTRERDRRRREGDGTADEEIAGGDDQCGNPTMIGEAMNGGAIEIYR